MKFDSNLAWKEASSGISANREVLLALAGVFFLLPGLALALFYPQPEPAADLDQKAMIALVSEYYASILPIMLPMLLFQAVGTLGLLTLLRDKSRPTVGQALKQGVKGILPYILAQIVLGLGVGLIGGLVLAIAAATGIAAVGAAGFILVFAIAAFAAVRTSLSGPVIAVEGERNPVAALKRSWQLTHGNGGRIALFYMLVVIAFLVVITIVSAIVGIVVSLLAGAETLRVVGAVLSSTLNAVMALYFVAIIAAVHRQLAGPPAKVVNASFK